MRLLSLLLLVAACHSAGSGGTPDGVPGGYELTCESHGTTFPALDKTCLAPTDCFVARHMVSCCGTQVALGLNVSSQSAFQSAETGCENAYPGCGCAALPTSAEDGRTEVMGAIQVDCRSGRCVTFVP